jgi:hypothetical protein
MDALTLASIYSESLSIVASARYTVANVDAVWSKLYRVAAYLQKQAESELGAALA